LHHRNPDGTAGAFIPVQAGHCRRHVPPEIEPGAVRDALEAVARSRGFARSPRMQRFLCYIVEETLAGRDGGLKEFAIAVEVFDRDSSYDPQTNSLVRVEASRLRTKLDRYNASSGADVVISLPAGTYVPSFSMAPPSGASPSSGISPSSDGGGEAPGADGGGPAAPRRPIVPAALIGLAALIFIGIWAMHPARTPAEDQAALSAAEAGAPTVVDMPTIAVLPLRNISGEEADDFLGDGLTDALITSLARLRAVRVIAYPSSRPFKNTGLTVSEVARQLGVSHVVEGTVLRDGGIVRISAKLIDAATGRYVWAESYDRPVMELLSLQADVANRIVSSLSETVTAGDPAPRAAPRADTDPAAQEAYLRGRYFRNMVTESGFHKGISYFKDAIAKDPDFAEAYSGMAACYCILGGHGFELVDPREGMPLAKQAIAEAMRLDDGLAEAHAFQGIIRLKYDWDWTGAEQAFRRSIQINPSYAQAHLFYSYFLEAMDDQAGAVREAEEARRLDPLSLPLNTNLIWQYLRAGRLNDARDHLERTSELNAGFWGVQWGYGQYYRQLGDLDRAIASFEKAVAAGGGHAMPIADLGHAYALAGRGADARRMLARLSELAETGYVSPYNRAVIHIGLGEVDEAFAQLEAAYAMRSRSLAWLKVAREFDTVRGDPRFQSLLRRVGLPL